MHFRHLARACLMAATMLLATLAALPFASEAFAQAASKHRVAMYTEGPRSNDITALLREALPPNAEVVPSPEFRAALGKEGQKVPLGITISLESKRGPMLGRIGRAVNGVNAEAVIIGYIQNRRAGGQEVIVLVVERGKDTPLINNVVELGKPSTKSEIAATLNGLVSSWKDGGGTTDVKPPPDGDPKPPGGDPKPDPQDPEKPEGAWERPENVYGHEIFQINASFDVGGRFFDYNDGVSTNLRFYSVFGAPGVSARVEVFPLAPLGIVFLRDLGVTGEFRINILSSAPESDPDQVVDTEWIRYGAGLRYRLPLGPREKPFVLGVRGSFLHDGMKLTPQDPESPLVGEAPSVDYLFMRVGLDGRFPIGPVAITAFGGYHGAVSSGDVHARFTDSSIGGIDVGGGLTVPILYGIEIRLQAEYMRWFYAFAPIAEPRDEFVAGGALDEYIHLELGPQYVF